MDPPASAGAELELLRSLSDIQEGESETFGSIDIDDLSTHVRTLCSDASSTLSKNEATVALASSLESILRWTRDVP